MNVNRGFETGNRLLFNVSLPNSYWEKGVGKQFLDRFFERLSTAPGVIAAINQANADLAKLQSENVTFLSSSGTDPSGTITGQMLADLASTLDAFNSMNGG